MGSSVHVGRIVVNTDSYVIVSLVGFQASETYCMVVFLLQFVLDFIVQIVVVEGVLGLVVLPSRMIKMLSTYVFYVSALSLVGVVAFFQDLQEEFCLYAGYRGVFRHFASNIRCLL